VTVENAPFRPKLTFPKRVIERVSYEYDCATSILEYGTGGSTVLASEMYQKRIVAVESDKNWAINLRNYLDSSPSTNSFPSIIHADVGPTGAWGHPTSYEQWPKYCNYPLLPWDGTEKFAPDVVLIDGRFRTACFLASLMMIEVETVFLFDDYFGRKNYKVVEEFIAPVDAVERMAIFKASPTSLRRNQVLSFVSSFFSAS
jgi:protein O-GlcNAc transferase